jgi:hypothetical protein
MRQPPTLEMILVALITQRGWFGVSPLGRGRNMAAQQHQTTTSSHHQHQTSGQVTGEMPGHRRSLISLRNRRSRAGMLIALTNGLHVCNRNNLKGLHE